MIGFVREPGSPLRSRPVTMVLLALLLAICLVPVAGSADALAARPRRPQIQEPAANGQIVHPADVHMVTAPFFDADGQAHHCTTWEIRLASTNQVVWRDACDTVSKLHVHLGDGDFVGPYAGRRQLRHGRNFVLRARHAHRRASGGLLWSRWASRPFRTSPLPAPGTSTAWTLRQSGFVVEVFARGFTLPVNIAFAPTPPVNPSDPFIYVAELYGAIKVVARDGSVTDYFNGALNYTPPANFPGSGEQGLTGLLVEPVSGDLFASMLYEGSDGLKYPKVVRFHTAHGGAVADGFTTIIDMAGHSMGPAHQISNLSIGPDGMLYVHLGDGFSMPSAQNLSSFRGKILRMTLAGQAPPDNPFYNAGDGITARDYVFAYGFRNPFGGAWRSTDDRLYMVENGPSVDRMARITPGQNYLWDGTDASMANHALYNWSPSTAPINISFLDPSVYSGSGFPAGRMGHAFVTESGPTYAKGPSTNGKRITEFVLDANGAVVSGPAKLIEYTGTGRATASGLAFGPDGLYFTDLYRDSERDESQRSRRSASAHQVGR